MNQGPSSDALKASDSNHSEYQALGLNQDHTSPYYAPAAPVATSWTDYWSNSYPRENGVGSVSGYNHVQPAALTSQSSGDGLNVTPVASTSSSGSVHAPQDYSGYASYSSTDPYGNAGYAGYYNSYQQQTTQSYLPGPPPGPPPVGAYQNSGAPYQPISSFQNTGSYAATTNNSSTYYNHADYQNSGGYQSGAFSNHTNYWPEGQYASYTSHQYPNYPAEPTSVYSSTSSASTTSSQYTQQYKQWPDYYNQTQTEVTCAPGTENLSVPGASSQSYPHPASTTGYPTMYSQPENPTMYSQPSAAYTPSWRPESNSSELPSNQTGTVNAGVHDGYWNPGTSGFQNHNSSSVQPHVQAPLPINSTYDNFQNQQKPIDSQGYSVPYPSSAQVAQTYQPSVQAVPPVDSRRGSKLQIPTNPRIASNLGLGVPKTDKDISANNIASKPAYVSVSLPKPNDKVPSDGATADSILKPGMFPKSLCGYVERSLARCKDDVQMAAAQAVMKEIITKSTADGTLYTKDWDTEPLFSLPNADTVYKEGTQFSIPASSLQKTKRSPNRRGKSRWEPISEEKPEKPMVATPKTPKFGSWNKQFAAFKSESKVNNSSDGKFSSTDEKPSIRSIGIPGKRQRLSNGPKGGDHGDKSSDSDKEQSLASYYPAAVALADSPEEKKRREHRSKRFDKGNGNRSENKYFKPKNFRVGNYHDRRASALVLSQNFEDSVSAAVEDIDWDALTVKGTCQDIEKRYLRLTSAPDPATVRPEEVLEKALLMVQKSERNYLYKCDQLKSIRQDLTVQRIRNELTVKVYETHARLAIEVGDLAEYNQCQSQLQTLYAEGIEGCHMEFAAYNLLCAILHSHNNRDLLSAMSRLSPKARKNDMVKHAFAVRGAVTSGNYVSFFRLYKAAPNLTSTYLMDLYVEKMRYKAVKCMSRSYRPTVPVLYISQVLGFSSFSGSIEPSNKKEIDGTEECIEWLKAHGACLMKDDTEELLFDTKISMSSLYMPEPEDAVAHGDASLAVDDFLTRTPGSVS